MAERLDQPKEYRKRLPRVDLQSEPVARAAEGIARFTGTPQFLIWLTLFVLVWLAWNTWAPETLRFDRADLGFTALTLMLSLQASFAAPLILLAQNRQELRDKLSLDEDRRIAAQSRADMDFLAREIAAIRMHLGELATRDFVRGELRSELRELTDRLDRAAIERGAPDHEAAP